MAAQQTLHEARQALQAQDRGRARRILGSFLREYPDNLEGWVLFSRVASTPRAAEWCLSRALEIDPQCEEALRRLDDISQPDAAVGAGSQPSIYGVDAAASTVQSPAPARRIPQTVAPPEGPTESLSLPEQTRHPDDGSEPPAPPEHAREEKPRAQIDRDAERELAARLRRSQAEIDRLRQREAALTQKAERAEDSLRNTRMEVEAQKGEIDVLKDELERLRRADADRKKLGERVHSLRRQLAEQAAKLEGSRRKAEKAKIELDGMAQIKAERERQLETLASETERLSDEIEEKQAKHQALERALQEAREEARALKEVRERLELARADRDALEDSLRSLEEDLKARSEELLSRERSLDDVEQRRADQKLKLGDLQSTNQKLTVEIAAKESTLEALESSLADVREELKELRRERARVSEPLDGQLAQVVEDAVQSGLSGVPSLFAKSGTGEGPMPNLMMIILVGVGVLLLLVGSILAYPHLVSRLWWLSDAFGAAAVGQAAPASAAAVQEPLAATPTPLASADEGSLGGESGSMGQADTLTEPNPTVVQTNTDSLEPTPIPDSTLGSDREPTREAEPAEDPTPTLVPLPAIPTRIVIPRLNVDAPIVPVGWSTQWVAGEELGIWEVPNERAAGWHDESAPLGEVGNTVLNGHNTTHGEVFRDLYRLDEDDVITLHAVDSAYRYRVAQTTIFRETGQPLDVRLEHAELLGTTEDERLTLITCHPYGSTANRLVITAFPESTPDEEDRFGG